MLTIGMAVVDDYKGLWATVQSLRLHHDLTGCQLIVVDNNPESRDGKRCKNLIEHWVKEIEFKYVPAAEIRGTAYPRQLIFDHATKPYVMCIDSHVFLSPGSITALKDFYSQNPDFTGLVQGMMVYDDLKTVATHFSDYWREAMWGTWESAWLCPCKASVTVFDNCSSIHNPPSELIETEVLCPKCGNRGFVPYSTSIRHLVQRGFTQVDATYDGQPFEIPSMGLGMFASKKDAWPGFNPLFRGFGGEEWYIHLKYKKRLDKTICIPQIKWNHRFTDISEYPNPLNERIFNYIVGHLELDISLDRCRSHFVDEKKYPAQTFDALLEQAKRGIPVSQITHPQMKPPETKKCSSCGGGRPPVVQNQETPQEFKVPNRVVHDDEAINRYKQIVESIGNFIIKWTKGSTNVLEVVQRRMEETHVSIIKSKPKFIASHSLDTHDMMEGTKHGNADTEIYMSKLVEWKDIAANDYNVIYFNLPVEIESLWDGLLHHATNMKGRIIFGGVNVRKEEFNSKPGILPAVRRLVKEHPEWSVVERFHEGDGFLVLSNLPTDKKPLPPLTTQAWNFAKALYSHAKDGFGNAPEELIKERMSLCLVCDNFNEGRCADCGCYCQKKASWPESQCPLGLW